MFSMYNIIQQQYNNTQYNDYANAIPSFHHSSTPRFSIAAANSRTDATSNSPLRSSDTVPIATDTGAGFCASW